MSHVTNTSPHPLITDAGNLGISTLLRQIPQERGFGDATLMQHPEGSIDLGGGNPSTGLLPTELYRDASLAVTTSDAFPSLLRYGSVAGELSLRTAIAAREHVDPERIIVTNGGAHGLALAVLGLLDAEDTIVVDDPVYPLFIRVLELVGVNVVAIPVARDGFDVDALAQHLRDGLRPKVLFTVPTFQNPAGGTLSTEKSAVLVDLAERYGFTIIADDPYREMSFPGTVVPDRPRLRDTDRVVAVNSFSKTLGPGLRLGWLTLPLGLTADFIKLRNRLDAQSSGILQAMVERMLADDRLAPSISAAGEAYAANARTLASALREQFGDQIEFADPTGGFFVWAQLRGNVNFDRLLDTARDGGVSYQRGEWFAGGTEPFSGFLRLSFAEPDDDALREGVARLGRAWRAEGGR